MTVHIRLGTKDDVLEMSKDLAPAQRKTLLESIDLLAICVDEDLRAVGGVVPDTGVGEGATVWLSAVRAPEIAKTLFKVARAYIRVESEKWPKLRCAISAPGVDLRFANRLGFEVDKEMTLAYGKEGEVYLGYHDRTT